MPGFDRSGDRGSVTPMDDDKSKSDESPEISDSEVIRIGTDGALGLESSGGDGLSWTPSLPFFPFNDNSAPFNSAPLLLAMAPFLIAAFHRLSCCAVVDRSLGDPASLGPFQRDAWFTPGTLKLTSTLLFGALALTSCPMSRTRAGSWELCAIDPCSEADEYSVKSVGQRIFPGTVSLQMP